MVMITKEKTAQVEVPSVPKCQWEREGLDGQGPGIILNALF